MILLPLLACTEPFPCGPGTGLKDGVCVVLDADESTSGLEDTGPAASTDDSGSPAGDTGEDSGSEDTSPGDTAPTDTDAVVRENPFAGVADIEGWGVQKPCDYWRMPCFQNLHMALRQGGDWVFVDLPIATLASVPDPILVPRTHDGEAWYELRVYYQDGNTDNHPGLGNAISFASLAFPAAELVDLESAKRLLGEEAGYLWVHRLTDAHEMDENIVDPAVEVIDDDGELTWLLFALQTSEGSYEGDPDDVDTGWFPEDSLVHVGKSDDGVSYELATTLTALSYSDLTIGSDQDPFPLDYAGTYPRPLPPEYGLDGNGAWGLHVSQGSTVMRFSGTLTGGVTLDDKEAMHRISVTTTSVVDGTTTVWGANPLGAHDDEAMPAELVRYELSDGIYTELGVALSPEEEKEAALGVFSPTMLPLLPEEGLELLVYAEYREAWEGFDTGG